MLVLLWRPLLQFRRLSVLDLSSRHLDVTYKKFKISLRDILFLRILEHVYHSFFIFLYMFVQVQIKTSIQVL